MSGHSKPSYTRSLVGTRSTPDRGKMPTKDSEMAMARFARRPDAAGEGTSDDSVEEDLIARRPSRENGARIIASVEFKWPFRCGEGGSRSE